MAKPVILTVDDDPDVLRAIERDLRQRYSDRYRILRAESGIAALDLLRRLQQRNDAVALLVVDHRMPEMNGVETLVEAIKLYPNAKRVLLTAYADTEAAIKAINAVQLNHYLLKPWDPPEQHLYPVLDDLLDDWSADFHPPFEGVRVLGTRWSSKSYDVRTFLARNQVPYQWLDADAAEREPEVNRLMESLQGEELKLPLVLFPDGNRLPEPTSQQIAAMLGLRTRAGLEFYDLAILGGGPAGLAAAVYGASEGLKTVMVEREAPGGQAGLSSRIENYLGFPSGLSGADLARRAVAQARRFGVEIVSPQEATSIRVEGPYRNVQLSDGNQLSCHALLLAMGVQWRKLDVPGLDRLQGAGVYYGGGATEAISCRGEDVYIVGGANSAGQAAMFFSQYARRVVMLVRGDSLAATMSQYLIDQIKGVDNIQVEYRSRIIEVHGDDHLEELSIQCDQTGDTSRVPAAALFIFIGAEPRTGWLDGTVERDPRGFVMTGPDLMREGKRPKGWSLDRDPALLETNVPGIFAVGDVRHGSIKRVASGVGEGSIAIQFVHQYLSKVS
ncbi:MAG: response regulator receiver modulated FAD-dependent pyridine nucleotide-disulfide oxidoreductase [Acidobacteriaceae bacterium]|nr:response regulator receiver modulated FAD-dependent pyridine nucleotide-disulfide oxidoreductase [Acidobacteriaceae bacterium]